MLTEAPASSSSSTESSLVVGSLSRPSYRARAQTPLSESVSQETPAVLLLCLLGLIWNR